MRRCLHIYQVCLVCSGQSQFFYNQYHLVRLAFSGPQGGDLIGRVLSVFLGQGLRVAVYGLTLTIGS